MAADLIVQDYGIALAYVCLFCLTISQIQTYKSSGRSTSHSLFLAFMMLQTLFRSIDFFVSPCALLARSSCPFPPLTRAEQMVLRRLQEECPGSLEALAGEPSRRFLFQYFHAPRLVLGHRALLLRHGSPAGGGAPGICPGIFVRDGRRRGGAGAGGPAARPHPAARRDGHLRPPQRRLLRLCAHGDRPRRLRLGRRRRRAGGGDGRHIALGRSPLPRHGRLLPGVRLRPGADVPGALVQHRVGEDAEPNEADLRADAGDGGVFHDPRHHPHHRPPRHHQLRRPHLDHLRVLPHVRAGARLGDALRVPQPVLVLEYLLHVAPPLPPLSLRFVRAPHPLPPYFLPHPPSTLPQLCPLGLSPLSRACPTPADPRCSPASRSCPPLSRFDLCELFSSIVCVQI